MIINAENLIAGRIATFAAKQSLLGETIDIVNAEKAFITGNKDAVLNRFKWKREMGTHKGPIFPKRPERILKRIIRGMLPYKKPNGRAAFKRIKCHYRIPEEFQGKEIITLENANISKVPNLKLIKIEEISKIIGAKL